MPKRKRRKRGPSNGVKKITQYLDNNKILYKKEYRFADCRDKLPLPFDFAVFKDEKNIILIEYNGVQHYKFCRKFHKSKKGLVKQQIHDLIKQDYCVLNNLRLIVISFEDEDKINDILDLNLS